MASGDDHTLVSVRGEARRTVAPDQVSLSSAVTHRADSTSAATALVGASWTRLCAELAELGGRELTVLTLRSPLTWSTQSIQTQPEYADKRNGQHGPTGRHLAVAEVMVGVRDFDLLDAVSAVLTRRDEVNVHSVQWSVDDDNREWALVRADAIHAALRKGQDYASALAGSIVHVEHVADAGLLGGETSGHFGREASRSMSLAGGGAGIQGPSLNPVPQELTAIIEARFSAMVGALPPRA